MGGHRQNQSQELLYDGRFTANHLVLVPSPLRPTTSTFFQLNTCDYSPYVTSSMTRGWVCHLQLLLVLASAVILGSESRGTRDHILLSQIRHSPNLEGQVPVLISPRNRVPNYTPRHWLPFLSPPTTRRATVEVFEPASTMGIHRVMNRLWAQVAHIKFRNDWFRQLKTDGGNSTFPPHPLVVLEISFLLQLLHMSLFPLTHANCAAIQDIPSNFKEPEGSSPCSQEPSTGPYPKPVMSIFLCLGSLSKESVHVRGFL
jgi:hypothetical protein